MCAAGASPGSPGFPPSSAPECAHCLCVFCLLEGEKEASAELGQTSFSAARRLGEATRKEPQPFEVRLLLFFFTGCFLIVTVSDTFSDGDRFTEHGNKGPPNTPLSKGSRGGDIALRDGQEAAPATSCLL